MSKFVKVSKNMDDKILEPLEAYNRFYKDELKKNSEYFFDNLVNQSKIDVDANRATVRKFDEEYKIIDEVSGNIGGFKVKRGLLIAMNYRRADDLYRHFDVGGK